MPQQMTGSSRGCDAAALGADSHTPQETSLTQTTAEPQALSPTQPRRMTEGYQGPTFALPFCIFCLEFEGRENEIERVPFENGNEFVGCYRLDETAHGLDAVVLRVRNWLKHDKPTR